MKDSPFSPSSFLPSSAIPPPSPWYTATVPDLLAGGFKYFNPLGYNNKTAITIIPTRPPPPKRTWTDAGRLSVSVREGNLSRWMEKQNNQSLRRALFTTNGQRMSFPVLLDPLSPPESVSESESERLRSRFQKLWLSHLLASSAAPFIFRSFRT